jgi:hypothetical protein
MPLPANIRALINNAWADGHPLLVATAGPDGPVIRPEGSNVRRRRRCHAGFRIC